MEYWCSEKERWKERYEILGVCQVNKGESPERERESNKFLPALVRKIETIRFILRVP
jgi:hypothetical protein